MELLNAAELTTDHKLMVGHEGWDIQSIERKGAYLVLGLKMHQRTTKTKLNPRGLYWAEKI